MPKSIFKHSIRIAFALVVFMSAARMHAQISSTSGSASTSWGGYNWQVDRAPITALIGATASFSTPPGLVQIPITIASPVTVHEVHGNMTLVTNQSGTCGNGSIIAQLLDQSGNAIAAVKLQQFGIGSTNVPITGTFTTPLSVTSFTIQYYVDLCGSQVVTFSLVVS
jgi:hypothetical protein